MTTVKAPPRRVDWKSQEDLEAMVLAALGFGRRCIASETGLTPGQITYRCQKSGIRITDYRSRRPNTVGGSIAGEMMKQARQRYKYRVADHLQRELPTKKESRAVA